MLLLLLLGVWRMVLGMYKTEHSFCSSGPAVSLAEGLLIWRQNVQVDLVLCALMSMQEVLRGTR